MRGSMEDVKDMFTELNLQRKTVHSLTFVKHKVTFDQLHMHEIANLKFLLDEELE